MREDDPDGGLVGLIGDGDAAAMRLLVATKLPRVLGLATRLLRDAAAAEDVAQEAFVRAWRIAPRWRPGGARFDTWLHTVVLNLCRDRLRGQRRWSDAAVPETADPSPDAEDMLIAAERGAQVAAAIVDLPERQRDAILLVHYQELSGADAAAALGIGIEALESLLARGRRTLRARLSRSEAGGADDRPS